MTGSTKARGPLLGLVGAAGAGKDAAGAVLVRAGWHRIAFADALRVEVSEAWGVHIANFVRRDDKDSPWHQLRVGYCGNADFLRWASYAGFSLHQARSPRWVMQQWGEFRRAGNPLHWVNQVEQWINHHNSTGHRGLVITDVRMANEAAMVRWRGGHLVRVHRPGLPPLPADTAHHASEGHGQLQVDADLHNTGSLEDLPAEVWRLVQRIATLPLDSTATASALATTHKGNPHA
jgi:hypothetical protein